MIRSILMLCDNRAKFELDWIRSCQENSAFSSFIFLPQSFEFEGQLRSPDPTQQCKAYDRYNHAHFQRSYSKSLIQRAGAKVINKIRYALIISLKNIRGGVPWMQKLGHQRVPLFNPFTTDRPKGSLHCIVYTKCRVVTNNAVSLLLSTSITSTM